MVTPPKPRRSGCPISFGLDLFGDAWSLLILRDAVMLGKCRFGEFAAAGEAIATNVLAERLRRLEEAGLLSRGADPDDGRRTIYRPTAPARALVPVLVELAYWGAVHDPATASPPEFRERYEADRGALVRSMSGG